MTIQKITDTKFLYQGQIVELAFLQAKAKELQDLIVSIDAAIKDIKFIELIPETEAVAVYVEAAQMYNKAQAEKISWFDNELIAAKLLVEQINNVIC